jgi:methylglyoxal synthase
MMRTPGSAEPTPFILALVAHDGKKDTLMDFCVQHRYELEGWELIATGSTGKQISEATGLPVQ